MARSLRPVSCILFLIALWGQFRDLSAEIMTGPGTNLWILATRNSHYVLASTPEGRVLNVWWGRPLEPADYDQRPLHLPPFSDGPARLEYPEWGGLLYSEPALKITQENGVRDLRLRFQNAVVKNPNLLEILLKDESYPVEVTLFYQVHPDFDLIERWVTIQNGFLEAPIRVELALSAAWNPPSRKEWTLSYLAGRYGAETQFHSIPLTQGTFVIQSRHGASSHQFNPWFALSETGLATEETGEVWFGQLAWSGSWKIAAELTSLGELQILGGIHDFDFEWLLWGGSEFTTPRFFGGYSENGFGEASRRLARFQLAKVLPDEHADELRPVIYNSWYATELDVNVEQQSRLADRAAEMGCELFVVDDGWFSGRGDDFGGLGDWTPDTNKFPGGLKPLINHVHGLGMKFGLWIEPEMVNRKSQLFQDHPDWIFQFPGRVGSEQRNQLMLNFSNKKVVEHLYGAIDALLSGNEIDFIKWDMNRHISEPGWSQAPSEQQKEMWVRHVRGVYTLIEALRAKHPEVLWENCSGGGGRADLGMLFHMDQNWVSDNTDPVDRLRMHFGYTHAFSPKTMVAWVTDKRHGFNQRETALSFRFHSAMTGSLGVGGNISEWPEADLDLAKHFIDQYKRIRPLVQEGDLYRLGSPDQEWCGFLYVSGDKKSAAALIFRLQMGFGESVEVRLPGLDLPTNYEIHVQPNTPGETARELRESSGAGLLQRGLKLRLNGGNLSMLLTISAEED